MRGGAGRTRRVGAAGGPAFRGARDAALIAAIYRRVPALWNETRRDESQSDGNPWKIRLATAFPRAAADTGLLRAERELRDEGWELAGSTFTRDGKRMLPVYEPPMIDVFDHEVAKPRYWIAEHGPVAVHRKGEAAERPGVVDRLAELGWNWEWLCAWRWASCCSSAARPVKSATAAGNCRGTAPSPRGSSAVSRLSSASAETFSTLASLGRIDGSGSLSPRSHRTTVERPTATNSASAS
jgi:hypothetical protein